MKVLIIGTGAIAKSLEKSLQDHNVIYDLIPYREFFKSVNSILKDSSYKKIYFVGIDKSNLLKNVIDTFKLIFYLNENKWSGDFYFFSTQQSIKAFSKNSNVFFQRGYYGWIKLIQAKLIQKLSRFNSMVLFLPYVIGPGTNWSENFINISKCNEVSLPDSGKNIIATCDVNHLAEFLVHKTPKSNKAFLYTDTFELKYLLERYNKDIIIHNVSFSYKEKLLWILKNSFLVIFLQIFRDLIKLKSDKKVNNKPNLSNKTSESKKSKYIASIEEKYVFSLNISIDKIDNIMKTKRLD